MISALTYGLGGTSNEPPEPTPILLNLIEKVADGATQPLYMYSLDLHVCGVQVCVCAGAYIRVCKNRGTSYT